MCNRIYLQIRPKGRRINRFGLPLPIPIGCPKCAINLASKGIRVNCITPGSFPSREELRDAGLIPELNRQTILGRVGRPEEIVGAVLLLASEASSYMTGTNIVVDGGWTAWCSLIGPMPVDVDDIVRLKGSLQDIKNIFEKNIVV